MSALVKVIPDLVPAMTLHQLAAKCYRESSGDDQRAIRLLASRIRHNDTSTDDALNLAASILIGQQRSNSRVVKLRMVHAGEDRGQAVTDRGLEARGEANLANLMAYRLPVTGIALGEATKDEIQSALLYHRGMRSGHGIRERWFSLVWGAMRDVKLPVKRQLKEADLQNMEKRARKDEERGR